MSGAKRWLTGGLVVALWACSGKGVNEAPDPLASFSAGKVAAGAVPDLRNVYQQMGLVASPPPIAFVSNAAFFASASPDTTLTVVSISFPNRGLTFEHDDDQYKATYSVALTVLKDSTQVQRVSGSETVRVGNFKETGRTDESIIFRQTLRLPPGQYSLSYLVRDVVGGHEAAAQAPLYVPRMSQGRVTRPIPVYNATPRVGLDSAPDYLAMPRASVTFGVDSAAAVYLESYGGSGVVALSLRDSKNTPLWDDTAQLVKHGNFASGTVNVPFDRANIGILTLFATPVGGTDTTRTAFFVGFGPDLPLISFEDMVSYLRYFASADKLQALQNAPVSARGTVWAAFLRSTDDSPDTPENEPLLAYFTRIQIANVQFKTDGPEGWLTDRGSVFVALGEPDAVYQDQGYLGQYSMNPGAYVHVQYWDYRNYQTRLTFYDETGGGQYRFTMQSMAAFQSLLTRALTR